MFGLQNEILRNKREPVAHDWPIWLLLNHFPACYYLHNCE